jgi:peptide subunit release factor 1 (eRF1)
MTRSNLQISPPNSRAENYVVALVGAATLRLFAVSGGAVEEVVEITPFDNRQVRHLRTVGTDHLGQSSNLQSKADENIRRNLRYIVREIDALMQSRGVDRLILAGTPKITSELRNMLPKRLFMKVIGSIQLSTDATIPEMLDTSRKTAEEVELDVERRSAVELVTMAKKGLKAVTGVASTLKAVNEGRVWQLVYAEGVHSSGFECPTCFALYSLEGRSCPMCGAKLKRTDNVIERAIERVVRKGGSIEPAKGEAAEILKDAGGIGAFLKARTARL